MVTVAESALRVNTRSVFVVRTTVGQHLNWYKASRESFGNSWGSCWTRVL